MRLHHFKLFAPHANTIGHAITTREGGVSKPPFHSLNLAYHVGDDKTDVDQNHALLAEALGYDVTRIVHMRQVHGNGLFKVDDSYDYSFVPECDALMTNLPGYPLMVMVADCIPILIFDPVNKAVAAVHAGRSGLFKEVITATVNGMKKAYGSQAIDLLVCLGGSIQNCCYEVGPEIVEEAEKLGFAFAVERRDDRYYLDNVAIAMRELKGLGVKEEHIESMAVCSGCSTDLLYSYRKEAQTTGRYAGVIFLKP